MANAVSQVIQHRVFGLKSAMAQALTTEYVGKVVEKLTGDRVRSRGITFDTSHPSFTPSIKAALLFGIYESAEIRFIRRYLRPDVDVVELGSSVGVTGAHILSVLGSGHSLTCVEANPYLLDALNLTLGRARRQSGSDFRIVHGLVSPDATPVRPLTARLQFGSTNLSARPFEDENSRASLPETVEVPRLTLPSLVANLHRYALVIDIEGTEVGLIAEAEAVFRHAKQLIIELHHGSYGGRRVTVTDMVRRLTDGLGFNLVDRHGPVLALDR